MKLDMSIAEFAKLFSEPPPPGDPDPADNMGLTDEQRSVETLTRLRDLHLRRYTSMLTLAMHGATGYRTDELEGLIRIWEAIGAKGFDWVKLNFDERGEVYDAVLDEG